MLLIRHSWLDGRSPLIYHGYRITFIERVQDRAIFIITRRHSEQILAKTHSVSEAIDLIRELEKQLELPFTQEVANDARCPY